MVKAIRNTNGKTISVESLHKRYEARREEISQIAPVNVDKLNKRLEKR